MEIITRAPLRARVMRPRCCAAACPPRHTARRSGRRDGQIPDGPQPHLRPPLPGHQGHVPARPGQRAAGPAGHHGRLPTHLARHGGGRAHGEAAEHGARPAAPRATCSAGPATRGVLPSGAWPPPTHCPRRRTRTRSSARPSRPSTGTRRTRSAWGPPPSTPPAPSGTSSGAWWTPSSSPTTGRCTTSPGAVGAAPACSPPSLRTAPCGSSTSGGPGGPGPDCLLRCASGLRQPCRQGQGAQHHHLRVGRGGPAPSAAGLEQAGPALPGHAGDGQRQGVPLPRTCLHQAARCSRHPGTAYRSGRRWRRHRPGLLHMTRCRRTGGHPGHQVPHAASGRAAAAPGPRERAGLGAPLVLPHLHRRGRRAGAHLGPDHHGQAPGAEPGWAAPLGWLSRPCPPSAPAH